jgi:prophage DNA circulation protein
MTDTTVNKAFNEIKGVVRRTTDNLKSFTGPKGREGAELRYLIGDLNANLAFYIRDESFADRLLACFKQATSAGITMTWLDLVLQGLVDEKPTTLEGVIVVENCVVMTIAQMARVLAKTEFVSRDDCEAMLKHMRHWFDVTSDLAADTMANPNWLALIELAGSITRYLADNARPLPRMITFTLNATLPSLTIAQLIYADGSRYEELAQENKTVHPLFMQIQLKGLSA